MSPCPAKRTTDVTNRQVFTTFVFVLFILLYEINSFRSLSHHISIKYIFREKKSLNFI